MYLCNRVESYIIKSSLSFSSLLLCFNLSSENNGKDHMLITWKVMTSHRRNIIDKIYWRLTNIALVIDAIHERLVKEDRFHI